SDDIAVVADRRRVVVETVLEAIGFGDTLDGSRRPAAWQRRQINLCVAICVRDVGQDAAARREYDARAVAADSRDRIRRSKLTRLASAWTLTALRAFAA